MPYDNDPNAREHDVACPLCLKGQVPWCRECNDVSEECVDLKTDSPFTDDRTHARAASWVKCPLCGGDGELVVGDSWDADDAAAEALGKLR